MTIMIDTNFQLAEPFNLTVEELAAKCNLSKAEAAREVRRLKAQTVYVSGTHQVALQNMGPVFGPGTSDIIWLSIKRKNKTAVHDWRELQAIKNVLVGAECEGVELYPAESRLVDTSNQFHLWVFANPAMRFPFGYQERLVMTPEEAAAAGGQQRAFA